MIVADIIAGLGNQLFIYAATKSIALDQGWDYRYRVLKAWTVATDHDTIDIFGHEWLSHFEKPFQIDTAERITEIPKEIVHEWHWSRLPDTSYNSGVYQTPDNVRLTGHFLCPRYFEHRRTEVLQWFRFRDEYLKRAVATREKLLRQTGGEHLVCVHLRLKELRLYGLELHRSYWRRAIQQLRACFRGRKLCFVVLSDDLPKAMRMLGSEKDLLPHRGSMLDDLCLMTLCDSHIISNSTFAWWGAWLSNPRTGLVMRPANYPLDLWRCAPQDSYPADWIPVPARREPTQFVTLTVESMARTCRRALSKVKRCGVRLKNELAGNLRG
jgi:hypothetical protein